MIDVLDRPRVVEKLKPEDFQAQLWIGLSKDTGVNVLPRYEIIWGQEKIDMNLQEDGVYESFQVYDRPQGGEALINGYIDPPIWCPYISKTCTMTIRLTCNFWPK